MREYREIDYIISRILNIRQDTLYPNKPYIQLPPRNWNTLLYIISGTARFIVNDQSCLVRAGEVQFFRSGILNRSEALTDQPDPFSYIYINFETPDDDSLEELQLGYSIKVRNSAIYHTNFSMALRTWNQKSPGYIPQCKEMLYHILNNLIRENILENGSSRKFSKIKAAIAYMENHFSEPDLEIDRLATLCSMSVRNFSRVFRELYNIPPGEYLMQVRISYAKELLQNATNSIGEIAERTGYSSIYSFSRSFKRINDISPTRWSATR